MLDWDNGETSTCVLENSIKLLCLYLVLHLLHQIKAQHFYTDLNLYQQCLFLQKIEEFKDFSRPLNDFPVLFKAYLFFKDFLRKPSKFKYFRSLCKPWNNWVITCDFQQCCILTSVYSYEPLQPPFKLRNSIFKWLAKALIRLRVCAGWYEALMVTQVQWAVACNFQQCGIFTSVDSYEPVQPPFKLRNLKWGSVSSLTVIEYLSDQQRLWSVCTYTHAGLSLCWLHIPNCWKSHATAHSKNCD